MINKANVKRFGPPLTTPELVGKWENELGSTMQIDTASGDGFQGTFTSSVSDAGVPTQGPLRGTIASDSIAFTVNWAPKFPSVTSWTGLVLDDGNGNPLIYALWHLASSMEADDQWWEKIHAGADLFIQASP